MKSPQPEKRAERVRETPVCPWRPLDRRAFLRWSLVAGAGYASGIWAGAAGSKEAGETVDSASPSRTPPRAPVAIALCKTYRYREVRDALARMFDQLGGLGRLVRGKSVVVKVNLVNTSKEDVGGVPLWLTVTVHPIVAMALGELLVRNGARRVTFCDQLPFRCSDEEAFAGYGFDWKRFNEVGEGRIRFLNTRNRHPFQDYAIVRVPDGGDVARLWEVNRIYAEADVLVSLGKLKEHVSGGITAGMKNLFGIPPSSLYGDDLKDGPDENAIGYRNRTMHTGERQPFTSVPSFTGRTVLGDHGINVPRFIVDLNMAFPISLVVLDAISVIQTAEGWWLGSMVTVTRPGLLIAGLNPVCTDAVAAAVMGFDPDAPHRTWPFVNGLNYLRLARQRGLGENRLRYIEVVGEPLERAQFGFHPTYRRINPERRSA